MAYKDLVINDFTAILFAGFAALVLISSCQDPTTTISTTHVRDTVLVIDTVETLRVDTVPIFHTDSIFVWCWEVDHNRDGHSADFHCDNGYKGPRQ